MQQIVSYVRVSTQRQGSTGLGLDAQRAAVAQYCQQHGATLLKEFTEVESGRNNDRPILHDAIAFAKRSHCKLVIGKLDRLARSVSFIANLMDSGIDFAACDLPEANRLLLHIMAAVAEAEARAISDRTIAALAAAKARGKALGAVNPRSRNLTEDDMRRGRQRGAQSTALKARESYDDVLPLIQSLRRDGLSLAAVANRLNDDGHRTRSGGLWKAMQVSRVLGYSANRRSPSERS